MITPDEIRKKAERLYVSFLRSLLQGESFLPLDFPIGKIPDDYMKIKSDVEQLLKNSKEQVGCGYQVELSQRTTRKYGMQSFPSRIVFETETDYLKFLNKEKEVAKFKQAVALIEERVPQLNLWLNQNPQKVIQHLGKWSELLLVCQYFQHNQKPNLYIRELPIKVHTKFIEGNRGILAELLSAILSADVIQQNESDFERRFNLRYDEPLVRVRVLDKNLLTLFGLVISDFSLPISEFKRLNLQGYRFIITENKMNFLTLPALSGSFALLGMGFQVAILKDVDWLARCPIVYWGDLDAQGFQILSMLRCYLPQTVSVMMDRETFDAFAEFSVPGTVCNIANLPYLTPDEHEMFASLSKQTRRLEQEKINQDFVIRRLDIVL